MVDDYCSTIVCWCMDWVRVMVVSVRRVVGGIWAVFGLQYFGIDRQHGHKIMDIWANISLFCTCTSYIASTPPSHFAQFSVNKSCARNWFTRDHFEGWRSVSKCAVIKVSRCFDITIPLFLCVSLTDSTWRLPNHHVGNRPKINVVTGLRRYAAQGFFLSRRLKIPTPSHPARRQANPPLFATWGAGSTGASILRATPLFNR